MKKHFFHICMATLLVISLLNACISAANTTPTPNPESLEMITTEAAQTAMVQSTQLALTQPATPTDTDTPEMPPTATYTLESQTPALPNVVNCANAEFISDVTIPDGMQMEKGEEFTKTWAVKNTGSCPWTIYFKLTYYYGEAMGGTWEYLPKEVPVGKIVNLSVKLKVPNKTGKLTGWWELLDNQGRKFGIPLSVVINAK